MGWNERILGERVCLLFLRRTVINVIAFKDELLLRVL